MYHVLYQSMTLHFVFMGLYDSHPDIRDRSKVDNIVGDIQLYQNKWLDRLERMDRSRLRPLFIGSVLVGSEFDTRPATRGE
jgi:hypothetical protein